MTAADLPLVRAWLVMPHVVEWWGDPDEQFELVRGGSRIQAMDQFIVTVDDRPFAYLQCYDPTAWPEMGSALTRRTRGIDQFIGDPAMIGLGHGSAFIRKFTDRPADRRNAARADRSRSRQRARDPRL